MLTLRCSLCAGIALLATALEPLQALAVPMDLRDPEPRWVQVRFELSPPDRPGQTDSVYSPPFAAWLEPGERPGEVSVTVDGRTVEQHLLTEHEPRPGSFSNFVWIFDAETGHVRSAKVSGAVRRRLHLGLTSWKVTARIHVEMDTRGDAGFTQASNLLGQPVHRFRSAPTSRAPRLRRTSPSHKPLGRQTPAFDPISALRNLAVAEAMAAISRLDPGPNSGLWLGRGL